MNTHMCYSRYILGIQEKVSLDFRLWRHNGLCLNAGVCCLLAMWSWLITSLRCPELILSGPESIEPSALHPLNLSCLFSSCLTVEPEMRINGTQNTRSTTQPSRRMGSLRVLRSQEGVLGLSTADTPWVHPRRWTLAVRIFIEGQERGHLTNLENAELCHWGLTLLAWETSCCCFFLLRLPGRGSFLREGPVIRQQTGCFASPQPFPLLVWGLTVRTTSRDHSQ